MNTSAPGLRLRRTVVVAALLVTLVGAICLGILLVRAGAAALAGPPAWSGGPFGGVSGGSASGASGPGGWSDDGALDAADGVLPDGVSVWDDGYPGIANLDPALAEALRAAATAAQSDGIRLIVNSGWRSPALQEQLLQDAEATYGSREEAERWVATPETSLHVSGDAADIGSWDAAAWLADHGAAYGLCPVYDNEPWHVERHPDAATDGCPLLYRDPTQDPRMQR